MNEDVTEEGFTTVVSGQHLYVLSSKGRKNFRIPYSKLIEWESLSDRNIDGRVLAAALNGFIYISDYAQRSNSMEAYEINRNTWNMIPGKHMSLAFEALATSDESVFTIGGQGSGFVVSDVERFNPATSSWANDGNLNVARDCASATTVGKTIFVLGGRNQTFSPISDVEFRCPDTRSWTRVTSMQNPRSLFNAVCFNQKIYAVGGDSVPETIEEYDPETKQWKTILSMDGMNPLYRYTSVALPV